MNSLQNDNCSFLFCTIDVKTGKIGANYWGVFTCMPVFNSRKMFTIVQSIPCIFFIKFDSISRKLLHTFVFNKLSSYDVTIPGSESKITWKLPTILPNIHTHNLKFIAVAEQCFFNANSKLKIKIGILWYKAS